MKDFETICVASGVQIVSAPQTDLKQMKYQSAFAPRCQPKLHRAMHFAQTFGSHHKKIPDTFGV